MGSAENNGSGPNIRDGISDDAIVWGFKWIYGPRLVRLASAGALVGYPATALVAVGTSIYDNAFHALETLHLAFLSSGRLMRVLGAIVLPSATCMAFCDPENSGQR